MISLRDVRYAYPGQPQALAGVSLEVPAGRTLGLVGANGSGKSTLLSLLAGLFAPGRGEIEIDGLASPKHMGEIRRRVGLVMQDADLMIIGATVAEDLDLARGGGDGRGLPDEVARVARAYGLADLLDRAVHELSWGQKKRLCLAATLSQKPSLLLLDEPFAGLDYPGIKEMRASLAANRAAGLTQVVAAHDLEPLADLVDQWAVMSGGKLVLQGPAEAVFDHLRLYQVRPPCSWQTRRRVTAWE